jgi:hypothetical protein
MITDEKRQLLEHFTTGRNLYKLMKFEEALAEFTKALKIDEKDGPSKIYYARCKHFIEDPPPEDWDGVFVMKSK